MTKRVIVHAGMPKCGSTYLQYALAANHAAAAAAGVFLPAADRYGERSNMTLARELSRRHRGAPAPTLVDYVARFEASGAHTMVLTCESFAMRADRLEPEAFGGLLDGYGVDLLLYHRRHDRWLHSYYKQSVRMDARRLATSFTALVRDRGRNGRGIARTSVTRIAAALERGFGAQTTTLIDLDAGGGDVVPGFEALSGLPLGVWIADAAARGDRRYQDARTGNVSISDVATLVLLASNRAELPLPLHRALRDALLPVTPPTELAQLSILSAKRSARLLAVFDRQNEALARRYGVAIGAHAPIAPAGPVQEELTAEQLDAMLTLARPHLAPADHEAIATALTPRS